LTYTPDGTQLAVVVEDPGDQTNNRIYLLGVNGATGSFPPVPWQTSFSAPNATQVLPLVTNDPRQGSLVQVTTPTSVSIFQLLPNQANFREDTNLRVSMPAGVTIQASTGTVWGLGNTLAALGSNGNVYLFSGPRVGGAWQNRTLANPMAPRMPTAIAVRGDTLVVGYEVGPVTFLDISGWPVRIPTPINITIPAGQLPHLRRVTSVALSRDGLRAFSSSQDGTVKVWNLDPNGPDPRSLVKTLISP
jgi:hypothetical protein